MFNFNAPPAAGAPAAPTQPKNQPMSAAAALAGFGDADIDIRDPMPPVGFSGLVKLLSTEGKDGRHTGFSVYIRAQVVRVANPGGAGTGRVKNENRIPATEGTIYTLPIRGFSKPDARAFAMSDLKSFLIAACENKGLTLANSGSLPPGEWDKLGALTADGKLVEQIGTPEFGIQVSEVGKDTNPFAKLKVQFYPRSQVVQG